MSEYINEHKFKFLGKHSRGKSELPTDLYQCTECGQWKTSSTDSVLVLPTEECPGQKEKKDDKANKA